MNSGWEDSVAGVEEEDGNQGDNCEERKLNSCPYLSELVSKTENNIVKSSKGYIQCAAS